jgi:phosphate-selective porin OprO and OprP
VHCFPSWTLRRIRSNIAIALCIGAVSSVSQAQPTVSEPPGPDASRATAAPVERTPTTLPAPPPPAVETLPPDVGPAAEPVATSVLGGDAPRKKLWLQDHQVHEERWVPEEGIEFESADKLFALALRLRAQFLYQVERPYDRQEQERADPEQNLTIRRARIVFGGHMWGEKTTYKVELAIAPSDLGMAHLSGTDNPPITERDNYISRSLMLDWYLQFNQLRDMNVRVGQYKVAYSRDRVVSSGNLQFVDRTLLNAEFNLDRDIGVDLRSKDLFGLDKRLRYYASVTNGDGHSQYELRDFGLMYLGRVEVLPLGAFDDYSQSDLKRTQKLGISIGAAYARIEKSSGTTGILGRRPSDGGTTDWDNVTADMTVKFRGLSIENAWFYRRGKRNPGDRTDEMGVAIPSEAARNGWGAGIQAGYLVPTIDLEFAARWSAVRASKGQTALRDANEVGFGVNYFLALHAYKVQFDWIRQWGEGVRAAGEDFAKGEDRIRLQLQAAY